MANKYMNARIQQKRDTSANWTSENPVLLEGELIVVDTENGVRFKIGDGTKTYTQLPFTDEVLYNLLSDKAKNSDLTAHIDDTGNPHDVTKEQVGLGNVENKSSETIRSEITRENIVEALGFTPSADATLLGIATEEVAGLVKSGGDISVDEDGVISVLNANTVNMGVSAIPLDSAVILYWRPVEGADGYRIQRYNEDTSSWSTIVYPSSTELSYCDTGLTNDTTYRYRMLYHLGEEWIHIGNEIVIAPNDMTYDIKGSSAKVNGHTVERDVPADAKFTDTTYSAFVKSGSTAESGLVPAPPTTAGTSKFLREDGTWSEPSHPTSLPADGGNSDTVNKGFMAVPLNGAVILYWNAIASAEKYRVQRQVDGGSLSTLTYPSSTTFSYCDTTVTNGSTYLYRLLYAVGDVWTTVANVTVHPSAMAYTAPKATAQSDTASTPTTSCLRQLASGTADPTTTTCPVGAWYGKHV